MLKGCFTAIITPFQAEDLDFNGLDMLVDFQISNGISGILAVGTTGESPSLTWQEHNAVIEQVAKKTKNHCVCIAGTGSNFTREALDATAHAAKSGVDAVLLVDPYYNGPSSLEIRKEYIAPIAEAFPEIQIIPYVIPGRTGTQLLPEDLALIYQAYKNVCTVKEATGSLENMMRTRECCGPGYTILSGDDPMTCEMMTHPKIRAAGVISVISNIAPRAVTQMVSRLERGELSEAKKFNEALAPLFKLVTVKTAEETPFGEVACRARNPLPLKTLMSILGMPSGACRKPLGKVTRTGLKTILETARNVQQDHPDIFAPLADFFHVNIDERLNNPDYQKGLYYETY
ncbi:MAG: 4-hydroxy-tetrahydrodipicolinate synthase [Desulfobacterales bacterium]|nr:4-hydroxy-tetrahydrodipicolinate synthase [Desulfobacterales bacterium]